MLKKAQNQNGLPRPPAVDGIKIFDYDYDQVIKCYFCLPTAQSYSGRQQ